MHLTDYRVRVLDTGRAPVPSRASWWTRPTGSGPDHHRVSENIIEASWQALYDSIVFGLLHAS